MLGVSRKKASRFSNNGPTLFEKSAEIAKNNSGGIGQKVVQSPHRHISNCRNRCVAYYGRCSIWPGEHRANQGNVSVEGGSSNQLHCEVTTLFQIVETASSYRHLRQIVVSRRLSPWATTVCCANSSRLVRKLHDTIQSCDPCNFWKSLEPSEESMDTFQ